MVVEIKGIVYRKEPHTVYVEEINFEEMMYLYDEVVGINKQGQMVPKIGSLISALLEKSCKNAIIETNNVPVPVTMDFINGISKEDVKKLFTKALELNPIDLGEVGF